ncbi:MAG: hypothetical protein WCQ76_05600 [Fusobacterium sp.]
MYIILIAIIVIVVVYLGYSTFKTLKEYNRINKAKISFYETYRLTGLPLVSFDNNGKTWNFLLDTGSMDSLIDEQTLEGMNYKVLDQKAKLFGIEGNDRHVNFCSIDLKYKEQNFDTEFVISDLQSAFKILKDEYNIQLHGMIGGKFFKKYKYIINFDELIAYSNKKK